jgi:hypothetical protein
MIPSFQSNYPWAYTAVSDRMLEFLISGSGSGKHLALHRASELIFGHIQFVGDLQVEPEPGGGSEATCLLGFGFRLFQLLPSYRALP